MRLTFLSSIVSGRTEQEIRDRKQETGNRKQNAGRRNLEKKSRKDVRIEANLPVLYPLREDGTGSKG